MMAEAFHAILRLEPMQDVMIRNTDAFEYMLTSARLRIACPTQDFSDLQADMLHRLASQMPVVASMTPLDTRTPNDLRQKIDELLKSDLQKLCRGLRCGVTGDKATLKLRILETLQHQPANIPLRIIARWHFLKAQYRMMIMERTTEERYTALASLVKQENVPLLMEIPMTRNHITRGWHTPEGVLNDIREVSFLYEHTPFRQKISAATVYGANRCRCMTCSDFKFKKLQQHMLKRYMNRFDELQHCLHASPSFLHAKIKMLWRTAAH